jgi:hypothetical protein
MFDELTVAVPLRKWPMKSCPVRTDPCEFYKATWDFVVADLLYYKCRKKPCKLMNLGKHINKSLVKFIPMPSDAELITSWWQITLLNVSYKILAKSLTLIKIIKPK